MQRLQTQKFLLILILPFFIGSCAMLAKNGLNNRYGKEDPQQRYDYARTASGLNYHKDIKPIIENRCVVCHGCYDAPCQLKLSAFEGLERGANKNKIYDGARLLPAELTRLFVDGNTPTEWRDKKFYPVLNERKLSAEANLETSVLYRMLELKQKHPLPTSKALLSESFDFSLNRDQQCPKIEEMPRFEQKYPLWGMPYGLPAIKDQEFKQLASWIEQGTPYSEPEPLPPAYLNKIDAWETFFNRGDNKSRLMNRYIYEHLFIANLYFTSLGHDKYFRLVRSKTPSGKTIEIIPSRRPYDDPGSKNFYYRLQRVNSTILSKTHMPYALNDEKMTYLKALFLEPDYVVDSLPGYQTDVASNPFIAFQDLPVKSRYRFMLDEAHFTIMGYIKGPVCRGQVALNVINDHFWVVFVDPESEVLTHDAKFLAVESNNLRLPAESENTAFPLTNWLGYSLQHKRYLQAKMQYLEKLNSNGSFINMDLVWNGNQENKNAALTVFRHFDSATVVKGMVGEAPKTAWLIGYPLLERIHYLLVSGFDVYGNVSHQLLTRLYMDFLRMEGEFNFLMLLPEKDRISEREYWYRDASEQVQNYVYGTGEHYTHESAIPYKTENSKLELFELIRTHLGQALDNQYRLNGDSSSILLKSLSGSQGGPVKLLPQISYLTITDNGKNEVFTLIRNNAHSNISTLFGEEKNRLPDEDTLTIVPGFLGSYPNLFLKISKHQVPEFIASLRQLKTEQEYREFVTKYGIRRNSENFWEHSDELHSLYKSYTPLEAGLLDYNRLENR